MPYKITFSLFLLFSSLFVHAQSWQPVTSPPDFLTDHTFGFSLNGLGYLVSGTTEFQGPTDAFWQFEPVSETWTALDPFPGPARGYGIGDVWGGKAYFGFGTSTVSLLRDLWVFDPDSMSWSQLTPCPCEPRLHPTFVANNGKIFVGLGNNNNGNQNDWWEYDIATDSWSQKPDFPSLIRHHPYQFAIGDYVYTGFGHGDLGIYKDVYRYDPSTEEWWRIEYLPGEGRVAGTQFSYNNRGYVLSGDGDDHYSMETGEFWMYDPALNSWEELPPHPGKSRWAPSSFIINGEVYLFNGTTYYDSVGSVYQSESYKFNLDSLFTSTNHIAVQQDLQVYPNPFQSSIHLDQNHISFESIRVYSLDQKLVYDDQIHHTSIDLDHLPPGMYRVEAIHEQTLYSCLLVKQ